MGNDFQKDKAPEVLDSLHPVLLRLFQADYAWNAVKIYKKVKCDMGVKNSDKKMI